MASEKTAPDDGSAPDPFEAELVAYLDGELDEASARKVEARLARDPAARARAAELKKSYDLLDYLPKPEPSATFTTRTLDKLPAVKPGDAPPEPRPAKPNAPRKSAVSTSVPVPLEGERRSSASRPRFRLPSEAARVQRRSYLWAGGLVAAVLAFAAVGYFASAAVRSHFFPPHKGAEASRPDPDARVIERLPLYAAADDIGFVAELATPEYFGDDPAVAFDPTLKVPPADGSAKPDGGHREALASAFRSLPAPRQAQVVKLDQDLNAKEPRERDRLLRVLEAYAAWLSRLPDAERKAVLAAPGAAARLSAIRAARDREWVAALPPTMKARLDAAADAKGKAALVRQWKGEEAARRDRRGFARPHGAAFAANKSPWPFDTERGRNEVVEFARHAFKTEDRRKCRLSPGDLAEYHRTLVGARADDSWAWYGLLVYELSRQHPYLPESDNPKLMVSEVNELPEPYQMRVNTKKGFGGPRARLLALAGKWPEFPLEVHREVPFAPFGKVPFTPPPLGPARPADFKQPVREFAAKELFPKLTADEKRDLDRVQGKWPDYPQRFLNYANKYDLSVPGVTLPGPPRKWEATYGLRPAPRP